MKLRLLWLFVITLVLYPALSGVTEAVAASRVTKVVEQPKSARGYSINDSAQYKTFFTLNSPNINNVSPKNEMITGLFKVNATPEDFFYLTIGYKFVAGKEFPVIYYFNQKVANRSKRQMITPSSPEVPYEGLAFEDLKRLSENRFAMLYTAQAKHILFDLTCKLGECTQSAFSIEFQGLDGVGESVLASLGDNKFIMAVPAKDAQDKAVIKLVVIEKTPSFGQQKTLDTVEIFSDKFGVEPTSIWAFPNGDIVLGGRCTSDPLNDSGNLFLLKMRMPSPGSRPIIDWKKKLNYSWKYNDPIYTIQPLDNGSALLVGAGPVFGKFDLSTGNSAWMKKGLEGLRTNGDDKIIGVTESFYGDPTGARIATPIDDSYVMLEEGYSKMDPILLNSSGDVLWKRFYETHDINGMYSNAYGLAKIFSVTPNGFTSEACKNGVTVEANDFNLMPIDGPAEDTGMFAKNTKNVVTVGYVSDFKIDKYDYFENGMLFEEYVNLCK